MKMYGNNVIRHVFYVPIVKHLIFFQMQIKLNFLVLLSTFSKYVEWDYFLQPSKLEVIFQGLDWHPNIVIIRKFKLCGLDTYFLVFQNFNTLDLQY